MNVRPTAFRLTHAAFGLGCLVHPTAAPAPTVTTPDAPPPVLELPRMLVLGQAPSDSLWQAWAPLSQSEFTPPTHQVSRHPDTAGFLADVPGAAVVRNGPLTGIVQLRGLHNDRVRLLVDGMTLTPACPNHMDPPLLELDPGAVQRLSILAGITPVSLGGDSIAGTVVVDPPAPTFNTNAAWRPFGRVGTTVRTASDGLGLQGRLGIANHRLSAAWNGSWQTARDYRFPGGTARNTGFDTQHHRAEFATRSDRAEWSVDVGAVRTRDAGTPSLPMDMVEDDTWSVGLEHRGNYGFGQLEARVYRHETDHRMDNFSLRPPGALRMFSPAESEDTGLRLGTAIPWDRHAFGIGAEFHRNDFDAYQQNATTGLRQDTLNAADRNRAGAYLEWAADWTPRWRTQVGVRTDAVWMSADPVERWFAASAADAARFNGLDLNQDDLHADATLSVRFAATDWLTVEAAAARKSRSPNLIERYLWTPLSASAGQADGRTYLGNPDLDPEVSHQIAGTAEVHGRHWRIRATPFVNWVSDYIQGVALTRLDANRLPVLQFTNLERADLHGVDAEARWTVVPGFDLVGGLSYVRARNADTGDDLYRVAPLRGSLGCVGQYRGWEGGLEVVLADRQTRVADYNGETPSDGYALVHARLGYQWHERFEVQVVIENLFDEPYADHLSGVNRVGQSDVAIGERLPGVGRNCALTVNYRF